VVKEFPEAFFVMFEKLKDYSNLIVLPHSVFALPFALASLLVATNGHPSLRLSLLVILAMVLARTFGMAYNRVVDAELDAQNPRTQNREIPTGKVTKRQAQILAWVCGMGFVGTCYFINALAFNFAPLVLAVLLFYSHTKRFTWLCHLVLGFCLGMAPVGAWIAAQGFTGVAESFWLLGAVTFFVAGFDILYSIQDVDFDKANGLHSWATQWGVSSCLKASRYFHVAMLAFLAGFGGFCGFSTVYTGGVGFLGVFLFYQHNKIYVYDRDHKNQAFKLPIDILPINGGVSVIFLLTVIISLYTETVTWHLPWPF
jgi:4-hydroxybenzoate polyprenyltransferase